MGNLKMHYVLFVLLCLIKLNETRLVQAQRPFNQTCLNFGHARDCRFYSCFEERFPCGSNDWIMDWGYKYCNRMEQSRINFDKNGQYLMKQVASCVIRKLTQQRFYTYRTIDCEQLRKAGQKLTHDCYLAHSKLFCSAFQGRNRDCFFQFIDEKDRQDFTLIRTLSHVGQKCTPKKRLTDFRSLEKGNQCLATQTN